MKSRKKFNVTSGKIRVSDPVYGIDNELATNFKAKNGKWTSEIWKDDCGPFGDRVSNLWIFHESVTNKEMLKFKQLKVRLCVDTGRQGFFDLGDFGSHYDENWTKDFSDMNVMKSCVIAMSGIGDGTYPCFVARDKSGQAIAAMLQFLPYELEDE